MTTDKALDFALEKVANALPAYIEGTPAREYLAVIHSALAAPVQEPFCFVYVENGEEYFAPKGAYVPDNAQPLYTTPPAQPAPVQEPVAWVCYGAPGKRDIDFEEADINGLPIGTNLYTTPPSAQRQWRGLTDKEFEDIIMSAPNATVPVVLWQLIQDKLKEKNT